MVFSPLTGWINEALSLTDRDMVPELRVVDLGTRFLTQFHELLFLFTCKLGSLGERCELVLSSKYL